MRLSYLNEAPKDEGNRAFLMMILFGVACLLPWNAILTSFAFYTEHVSELKDAKN